jgi:hypothetical protein
MIRILAGKRIKIRINPIGAMPLSATGGVHNAQTTGAIERIRLVSIWYHGSIVLHFSAQVPSNM